MVRPIWPLSCVVEVEEVDGVVEPEMESADEVIGDAGSGKSDNFVGAG